MKTILVPTDYSEVSENALNYAAELANLIGAKLILLHAYHIPTPTLEVPVVMVSSDELQKENEECIGNVAQKVMNKHKHIQVKTIVSPGFAVDEILSLVNEGNIDLVVMGVTGAGRRANMLLGSNTISIIKKSDTPVLIIPESAQFRKIQNIVLAYDYKNSITEKVMREFKKIVKMFGAKVFVLDIVKPEEVPAYEEAVAGISLENNMKDIEHSLHFPVSQDITEEINSFVDSQKADWLVMIPNHHSILSELFHRSNTKKMAFHSHIPFLSLHA